MSDADAQRDPLDALAAEFAERLRRGELPSVSEYAAEHPELAEDIQELFPAIAAMERLKAAREHTDPDRGVLGPVKLERLGDFRIIREIGRGGMGIVYEAVQESLGRHVAIKVLPTHALLDAKHVKRFTREARIAARLHHTNIVPVFGVGEQDGFHYYVMQMIHGVGLDTIVSWLGRSKSPGALTRQTERMDLTETGHVDAGDVARLVRLLLDANHEPPDTPGGSGEASVSASSDAGLAPADRTGAARSHWQWVARVGRQVADALSYAHAQGTLHRDIKPGNLLLDARGVVWVTDFGVAKAVHSETITQTGDITGTLRYMAPEQFSGRTDVRSDIYSLGLTLYELLTLRPAYGETKRTTLIRQITQGRLLAPRKTDPHIPRDLETIVLKAVAGDPEHRYPSAEALADDLQRFLEDRPIRARRATSVERLWRWCRRNPAVAGLVGSTLLLLILVAVVGWLGYVHTKSALEGEARQRASAEANAELTAEALDRIFERFSPARPLASSRLTVGGIRGTTVEVATAPVLSKQAAALLEEMLVFYGRLAKQGADQTRLRRRAANANRRVGDIRQRLGQYERAAAAYHRAIAMYRQLAGQSPASADLGLEIPKIQNELGRLYRSTRRHDRSRQAHLEALAILQAASGPAQAPAEVRYELARTYYLLGTRERPDPGSRPGGPPAHHRGPPPELLWLGPPAPDGPPGAKPPKGDDVRGAYLAKAVDLLTDLVKQHPSDATYRHLLALCYRDREPHMVGQGPGAGKRDRDRAVEILEHLVRDFPHVPDYRYDLCEAYARFDMHRPPPPGETYASIAKDLRKALRLSDQLVARHPYILRYVVGQVHLHHRLGIVLERMHRPEEAEQAHRKAVAIYSALGKELTQQRTYRVWLAAFRNGLVDVLIRRGADAEARPLLEDTIKMLSAVPADNPEMWFVHAQLDRTYRMLAHVLHRTGQPDLAAKAEQHAAAHRRKIHAKRPDGRHPSGASADQEK